MAIKPTTEFPSVTEGLPESSKTTVAEIGPGESYHLRIEPVVKQIGDSAVRMLGYNGSIPGPTLRVRQGSEIVVRTENRGDLEATVHWHGLRLDNRYDGTHETQRPMEVSESFEYRLAFPDAGVYWYHPHIREDYAQELGLYGNILVVPADGDYWAPAHREVLVTLDDVLLEGGRIAAFSREQTNYSAMGRFGNTMLVAGEPHLDMDARRDEVVRFYFTNTANTRVFNVGFRNARMKLVGGDSGRCEREEFVDSVILAPSERAVVDVLFDAAGSATLEHRTPERTYELGSIVVTEESAAAGPSAAFETLRVDEEMVAARDLLTAHVDAEPDRSLAFIAEMEFEAPEGPLIYVCPMHPEVVSDDEGKCPVCGMKLFPAAVVAATASEGHGHAHESAGGIEWEDDMVELNRTTTPANTRWKLVDRATGAANEEIDWKFKVGDRVKIRLVSEMDSDHPMHHPFHIHGAGRFLVLARDDQPESNLVWKDSVLVKTGEVVDILLDVTHAGRWMAHCHIAEHHESGMHFSFEVTA